MKLYPSFRKALRAGRLDLRGRIAVVLVSCGFDPSHESLSDVPAVAPERPLSGAWEGGGEDDGGDPLPEKLTAPDTVWDEVTEAPRGCVLAAGGVLIGYCPFPEEKCRPGEPYRLKWPEGVLILE